MARHTLNDPRVEAVVQQLVEHFLHLGSVRAVHRMVEEALARVGRSEKIYPNRLHALLSGDVARGVNTSTLESLEEALRAAAESPGAGERESIHAAVLRTHAMVSASTAISGAKLIRRVAELSGIPASVVAAVLGQTRAGDEPVEGDPAESPSARSRREPDWTFQDTAIRNCLAVLRRSSAAKVGLVVPTGGGKTRIAIRIVIEWLRGSARSDSTVLWVTHREQLDRQARRELQRALHDGEIVGPVEATTLFESRIRFTMVGQIKDELQRNEGRVELVVVDEAHHAAAPSYRPILDLQSVRGLFLTATPNRADGLPIGIDTIAYAITYRELFDRGVIVEPVFDDPVIIDGFDWDRDSALADLADYLLARSEEELAKILVAVTRKEAAERLWHALADQLDSRTGHPLSHEDLAFVHGGVPHPAEFLDQFRAKPRGILVATSQLVGEGFDDPAIDAAVITYASSSIGHLMQVAGRALRWSPGKRAAHIVQVHGSKLEYHFEQPWLYQDVSDSLRPQLEQRTYRSPDHLRAAVQALMAEHNVVPAVARRVLGEIASVQAGEPYSLMLTGLPYYGPPEEFVAQARWGAVGVTQALRPSFVRLFNEFSDRGASVNDPGDFLAHHLPEARTDRGLWKSCLDALAAMSYAKFEIDRVPYSGMANRPHHPNLGTSWLRYVTFEYAPELPAALGQFLRDAVNRDAVAQQYTSNPGRWASAVKVPLPISGAVAFLLAADQVQWFAAERAHLAAKLASSEPQSGFAEITRWQMGLGEVPLPQFLISKIEYFLRESWSSDHILNLAG